MYLKQINPFESAMKQFDKADGIVKVDAQPD